MTFPAPQLPTAVRAILLLPAGMRAFDEDFTVDYPAPRVIDLAGVGGGSFVRVARHYGGAVDQDLRALYVLGGRYLPYGCGPQRAFPDEAHDQ